jgi:hypothetical protein
MKNGFQLTEEEADIIRWRLKRIVQIDGQIVSLREELEAECNALEMAWQSAYRRNLLDKLKQGVETKHSDFHVPPAIENGELKIALTEEYKTRVVRNG